MAFGKVLICAGLVYKQALLMLTFEGMESPKWRKLNCVAPFSSIQPSSVRTANSSTKERHL